MIDPQSSWMPPTPELLAAYADGEFEGREALLPLRRLLDDWIGAHPDAQAELSSLRRLRLLCEAAAPAEPSEAQWRRCIDAVVLPNRAPLPLRTRRRKRLGWRKAAAAALLAAVAVLWSCIPQAELPTAEGAGIVQAETAASASQAAGQADEETIPLSERGGAENAEHEGNGARGAPRAKTARPILWARQTDD